MSEVSSPRLRVEERDGYVLAVLDRPKVRNAIDQALITELHELCARLERHPQVLVLTGSEGVFAAGADIRELRDRGPEEALSGINSRAFQRVASLPLPTIAAVGGPAIGGGAELAYACDFRIASERALFGNPEPNLGIIAGAGACWRLKEIVGLPIASEVLLAGRRLDAQEALASGLVTQVTSPEALAAAAEALAQRIARAPSLALRLTKLALHSPAAAHPAVDDLAQAVLFQTAEKHQRMTDFLEKKGRSR